MILPSRLASTFVLGLCAFVCGAAAAHAQGATAGQPVELGKFGDWNAYAATAKGGKVCYALAQPESRRPRGLNRDPAYFFISNRPKENVRNEISVIIGFPVKSGSEVELDVDRKDFTLYTREDGAFMRSADEEKTLVQALRRGRNMTVKSVSTRGRTTTDAYPLSGLSDALERIDRECK